MLVRSTPLNYRAQCTVLAHLYAIIAVPLRDSENPTQVNPEWAAEAREILRGKGASSDAIADFDKWVEDENESGLLRGTTPRIPTTQTTRHQNYVAVDRRGDTESDNDSGPGVYAISGGALRISGYVR